jgi:hypothetical protein
MLQLRSNDATATGQKKQKNLSRISWALLSGNKEIEQRTIVDGAVSQLVVPQSS